MIKKLYNNKDTNKLAYQLASKFLQEKKKNKATVIALSGDLGVGKTTFTQAFAKAMGIRKRILSPTFLIMKRFPFAQKENFNNLYHIDAYRIKEGDLEELGFQEILEEPNIILVEWADKVKNILPKDTLWLRFKHGNKQNEREVTIN